MSKMRLATLAGAALVLAGLPAAAQEIGGVAIRGFVSQGFLKSSANRYVSTRTDVGTFAFTEAAVNFNAEPLPRLRVGAQVLARDLGSQGNNRLVLDWGLGEYQVNDWLGVRAGRVKFPVGLYNTLADADMGRPELLQPSGIYPLERRDITNGLDGGGVYGTVSLGKAGYLEYEALVGTLDLDDNYVTTRFLSEASASLVRPLTAAGFKNLDYTVSEVKGEADWVFTSILEWRPPVAGLRLRGTWQQAALEASGFTSFSGFLGPAPVALGVRTTVEQDRTTYIVSGEYQRGGLRLSLEHQRQPRLDSTIHLQGLPFPAPDRVLSAEPESTYGQVAYRFNDHFQASTYYSVSYTDGNDKDGDRFVVQGTPAYQAWVKDFAVTARVDLTRHWLFKAEFHSFDGVANLSQTENPKPLEQNWTLWAFKTTFYF